MKNYMLAEGEMGRMPERGRCSETIKRDTAVVKNYKKALRKRKVCGRNRHLLTQRMLRAVL